MKRPAGGFSLLELLLATTIAAGLFAFLWTLLRPVSGEQRAVALAANIQALADNIKKRYTLPAGFESFQMTQPRYGTLNALRAVQQGLVPEPLIANAATGALQTPWGQVMTLGPSTIGGGPVGSAGRITISLSEPRGRDRTYCSTLLATLLPRVDYARIAETGEEVGLTIANTPTPQRIQTLIENNCARDGALTLEVRVQ